MMIPCGDRVSPMQPRLLLPSYRFFPASTTRPMTKADLERIAKRVAELLKESKP